MAVAIRVSAGRPPSRPARPRDNKADAFDQADRKLAGRNGVAKLDQERAGRQVERRDADEASTEPNVT
jgi:hypothetical protein